MGTDEVFYVQRMLGISIVDIMKMESSIFYWVLENLLAQETEEMIRQEQ